MQDACDWLVAAIYVVAAAIAMFSVSVRCRATVVDVERYSMRRSKFAWYAFRASVVVVLLGGIMHARAAAFELFRAAATSVF